MKLATITCEPSGDSIVHSAKLICCHAYRLLECLYVKIIFPILYGSGNDAPYRVDVFIAEVHSCKFTVSVVHNRELCYHGSEWAQWKQIQSAQVARKLQARGDMHYRRCVYWTSTPVILGRRFIYSISYGVRNLPLLS
jgi:hypothetical protein